MNDAKMVAQGSELAVNVGKDDDQVSLNQQKEETHHRVRWLLSELNDAQQELAQIEQDEKTYCDAEINMNAHQESVSGAGMISGCDELFVI